MDLGKGGFFVLIIIQFFYVSNSSIVGVALPAAGANAVVFVAPDIDSVDKVFNVCDVQGAISTRISAIKEKIQKKCFFLKIKHLSHHSFFFRC